MKPLIALLALLALVSVAFATDPTNTITIGNGTSSLTITCPTLHANTFDGVQQIITEAASVYAFGVNNYSSASSSHGAAIETLASNAIGLKMVSNAVSYTGNFVEWGDYTEAVFSKIASDGGYVGPAITIGGGVKLTKMLGNTASLDFDFGGYVDHKTVTVSGAAVGDTVIIGQPILSDNPNGVVFSGYVSATNTVTIVGVDVVGGSNPSAATFRVTVLHFQ